MSDANRELAQKQLDEEKAARDKAIQDKIQQENIRRAKWEKAQNLVSATVSTATAVVSALGAQPWTLANFLYAGLVGAAGAFNIAKIATAKIPAYAKGSESTPEGWGLYGEVRPEVRETRTGEIYFAEKPTLTYFNKGDKVYKSVEEYQQRTNSTAKGFEFDYDKMADKMPSTNINLDSRGIWSLMTKQGSRVDVLNRRWKLGN